MPDESRRFMQAADLLGDLGSSFPSHSSQGLAQTLVLDAVRVLYQLEDFLGNTSDNVIDTNTCI